MTEAERIEKNAREFTKGWGENCDLKSYIAGAKAENERLQQQSYDQCEIISHLEQQIKEKDGIIDAQIDGIKLEMEQNIKLKAELKSAQELNRELVEALKRLTQVPAFRMGWAATTKEFESLINKAK